MTGSKIETPLFYVPTAFDTKTAEFSLLSRSLIRQIFLVILLDKKLRFFQGKPALLLIVQDCRHEVLFFEGQLTQFLRFNTPGSETACLSRRRELLFYNTAEDGVLPQNQAEKLKYKIPVTDRDWYRNFVFSFLEYNKFHFRR